MVDTIDTLERENARLRSAQIDNLAEIGRLKDERIRLRYALQQGIINAGGVAEADTSTDFLCLFPAEVGAIKYEQKKATARAEKAEALNTFFRDSVGECHMMISRDATEYQCEKQDWESTALPPRVRQLMRAIHELRERRDFLLNSNNRLVEERRIAVQEMNHQIEKRVDAMAQWNKALDKLTETRKDRDALAALAEARRVALDIVRVELAWIIQNVGPIGPDRGDSSTWAAAQSAHAGIVKALAATPSFAPRGLIENG